MKIEGEEDEGGRAQEVDEQPPDRDSRHGRSVGPSRGCCSWTRGGNSSPWSYLISSSSCFPHHCLRREVRVRHPRRGAYREVAHLKRHLIFFISTSSFDRITGAARMQKLLIHGTSVHVTFTLTLDITEVFFWSQYEQAFILRCSQCPMRK